MKYDNVLWSNQDIVSISQQTHTHPKNHIQLQYVLLPQISLNPYKVTAFFGTPK